MLRRARIPLLTVIVGLLLSGCGVNNIPTYDESAKAKWSDVQNQYQRRADLIPKEPLINAVASDCSFVFGTIVVCEVTPAGDTRGSLAP